jgi:hypothetical protein
MNARARIGDLQTEADRRSNACHRGVYKSKPISAEPGFTKRTETDPPDHPEGCRPWAARVDGLANLQYEAKCSRDERRCANRRFYKTNRL